MSKQFAEQIIDSMVDENGHCGDRAISAKQFNIIGEWLERGEWQDRGGWQGQYKTIWFNERFLSGNVGKYRVVLSEFWHFNPRYTVVSIDLRPQEELDAEAAEEERMRQLRDFSRSEWQLEPKKRAEFDLILVNDYEYDGMAYSYYDSGERHIYTFRDADGNCYVWKTANPLGMWVCGEKCDNWVEAEIGDKVSMKATVKEHSEYKGTKQTVLTRAKLLAIG